jgi:hypothetical protein
MSFQSWLLLTQTRPHRKVHALPFTIFHFNIISILAIADTDTTGIKVRQVALGLRRQPIRANHIEFGCLYWLATNCQGSA